MNHGLVIATSPEEEYSVISPEVVTRLIRPGAADSVNQSAPSGPAAMPSGFEFMVRPALNFMTSPVVEIRPMPPGSAVSVNQLAVGARHDVGGSSLPDRLLLNSVITPAMVIAPILPVSSSVNQSLLSGPLTIEVGSAPSLRLSVNPRWIELVGVIRPITFAAGSTYQRLPSGPTAMSFGSPAGNRELGDLAGLGHAGDPAVAAGLGNPEVAVRPGDDAPRLPVGSPR